MKLETKIMNIQTNGQEDEPWSNCREAYKYGHRDARHAAAELATAHDALMQQMAEALEDLVDTGFVGGPQLKRAEDALRAYYKGQQ